MSAFSPSRAAEDVTVPARTGSLSWAGELNAAAKTCPRGRCRFRLVKLLVLASEPVDAAALRGAFGDEVEGAEVRVVSPAANSSPLAFWVSDSDEAIEEAKETAGRTVESLKDAGMEAQGDTGEGEPLQAIADALATFEADRVVIFVRGDEEAQYREDDVVGRAERRFGRPVVQRVLDGG